MTEIPNSTSLPMDLEPASMMLNQGEAIRSVYLFGSSYLSGEVANEIFEVKFKQGRGVTHEPRVVRLVARFTEKHEAIGFQAARIFNRSKLYVVAQDGGYIIDTKTISRCSSLPLTQGYKSTPIVVSAYDKLYCLLKLHRTCDLFRSPPSRVMILIRTSGRK